MKNMETLNGKGQTCNEEHLAQDMRNRILKSAENIQIPEQLNPEAVKASLDKRQKEAGPGNKFKSKNRRTFYRNLAAAACLCLCFGGTAFSYFYYNSNIKNSADSQIEAADSSGAKPESSKNASSHADVQPEQGSNDAAVKQEEKPVKKIGKFYKLASDYREVYNALEKTQYGLSRFETKKESAVTEGSIAAEDIAVKNSYGFDQIAENTTDSNSKEFSTTNLQVAGVDESDAVKTDGKYIYVVQEEKIKILDAQGKELKLAATLKPDIEENLDSICEIYVADNVLTVVLQADKPDIKAEKMEGKKDEAQDGELGEEHSIVSEEDVIRINYDVITKVLTYDITDPLHPALLDTVEQDGYYQTSRKIANHLYLFTNKAMYIQSDVAQKELYADDRTAGWIPCINGKAVKPDCIYLPNEEGNQGVVMTCLDLAAHCNVTDTTMLVNQGGQLYVTMGSAYFYSSEYTGDTEKTKIVRFALDTDGKIRAKAAAVVKGDVTDTFALDESDGYLRVLTSLTTKEPWENRVYVIRTDDMKVAGKLTGIAKGEMIYAARFVGTTGYFVTYRNTDPLFTVDFSNPENPKLIGELAVTGFSEYLHFWSDHKLLGIGYETNPENGEIIGVKLSMYDISNPKNVTEQAKFVLQDTDDSEAMYDYKSVLIDRRKNLIAFTTYTYAAQYHADYHVFSFKNGKFTRNLQRSLGTDGCGDHLRSLYIGDMLYLVGSRKAIAFCMPDQFKETGKITY